jgi:hypothetical protein
MRVALCRGRVKGISRQYMPWTHKVRSAGDCANGDLQDGSRLNDDHQANEEELAQHLHQLPPVRRDFVLLEEK